MSLIESILQSQSGESRGNPGFPHAPENWTTQFAEQVAQQEGIKLDEQHWAMIRALQEYFHKHQEIEINARELHDALDEKFHAKGGIRYLYQILPGGPVAQGCRLAGLQPPAGSSNKGFGSVM